MKTSTLHTLINLRGHREQAFKFAFKVKGGMRQCYTRGCEIFCPMMHTLKGTDLSPALPIQRMYSGEDKVNIDLVYGA